MVVVKCLCNGELTIIDGDLTCKECGVIAITPNVVKYKEIDNAVLSYKEV